MPSNSIREVGRIVDLVKQMRHKASAVYTPPNRVSQPFDTAQRARNKVKQAEHYLEASKQPSKQPSEQPRRTRWGPNKLELSSDKDNHRRRKKTHIKLVKKKALVELAANIYHTDLNRRRKDEFWKILVHKR